MAPNFIAISMVSILVMTGCNRHLSSANIDVANRQQELAAKRASRSAQASEGITHYPVSKRSASLPLLHLWQEHFGFISDEAITWIAAKLGLEPVHVLELVTFYPMYRRQPAGRTHIRICRTLSCALGGAYEL